MMVLARWIKHPLDVTVQGSHDADPRKHRRPAFRRDQDQGLHRSRSPPHRFKIPFFLAGPRSATVALRRAQTSIALGARGATACHFRRVPSLKAFGRRPRCKPHRCDQPASETLNNSGPNGAAPDSSAFDAEGRERLKSPSVQPRWPAGYWGPHARDTIGSPIELVLRLAWPLQRQSILSTLLPFSP
jgi:hypothetical protein